MLSDAIMILSFALSTIICVSVHHKQNTKPANKIKKRPLLNLWLTNNNILITVLLQDSFAKLQLSCVTAR